MGSIRQTLNAAAIAIPLAFGTAGPASAGESVAGKSAEKVPTAGNAVSKVSERTSAAVNVVIPAGQDFRAEVRHYLHRERCYALSYAPKNVGSWLAAIGELDALNESVPGIMGTKLESKFEAAKDRLAAERIRAGTDFTTIMDPRRPLSKRETDCVTGKGVKQI